MTSQTSSENEISVYGHGQITQSKAIAETEKILVAFPKIEPAMLKLLRDRFKANGFTDKRMEDAVNHVIDSYTGFDKLPSIGDFVSYDKKVECISQLDLQKKITKEGNSIKYEYTCIDIKGKPYYVKNIDFERYHFQKFEPKPVKSHYIYNYKEPTESERKETSKILKDILKQFEVKDETNK